MIFILNACISKHLNDEEFSEAVLRSPTSRLMHGMNRKTFGDEEDDGDDDDDDDDGGDDDDDDADDDDDEGKTLKMKKEMFDSLKSKKTGKITVTK